MKLANKVAWITGGNSGIGFAAARLFVTEGAGVAITGRNAKTLQAAAKGFYERKTSNSRSIFLIPSGNDMRFVEE